MMKKIAIGLILVATSFLALADWIKQGENADFILYTNADGITKSTDQIKIWYLFDFKSAQIDAINNPYLSARELWAFNCQGNSLRKVALTWFSGNMARGTTNRHLDHPTEADRSTQWRPVAPETFDAYMFKNACKVLSNSN